MPVGNVACGVFREFAEVVMEEKILLGRDRQIVEIPRSLWEQHLAQIPLHSQNRLNFMTDAHGFVTSL
jgi:hypothetical protein